MNRRAERSRRASVESKRESGMKKKHRLSPNLKVIMAGIALGAILVLMVGFNYRFAQG